MLKEPWVKPMIYGARERIPAQEGLILVSTTTGSPSRFMLIIATDKPIKMTPANEAQAAANIALFLRLRRPG